MEVGLGEGGPLGRDDQAVGAIERGIHVLMVADVTLEFAKFLRGAESFRVGGGEDGAFREHLLGELDGDRFADVVGILFEGEAPESDFLLAEDPEFFADLVQEAVELVEVDLLHFLQQAEGLAEGFGDVDEGLDVLREAGAAVAEAGVEEGSADALVHADAFSDLFDVGAGSFADVGHGVDVGNLEREERVRGVLDQLGRVDVGDENGSDERLVNLLHVGQRALVVGTDDDAVGVEEVIDGAAFAEEFGVRHDAELDAGRGVAADGLLDLVAGLHGHCGLVHDHAVAELRGQALGDLAGDLFDEGKVHGAVGLWRGRHGDEDHLAIADAFFGGGGELQAAGGHVGLHEFFQAGFEDGHLAFEEGFDLFGIVVHAGHFMTDFGEAGSGGEGGAGGDLAAGPVHCNPRERVGSAEIRPFDARKAGRQFRCR